MAHGVVGSGVREMQVQVPALLLSGCVTDVTDVSQMSLHDRWLREVKLGFGRYVHVTGPGVVMALFVPPALVLYGSLRLSYLLSV